MFHVNAAAVGVGWQRSSAQSLTINQTHTLLPTPSDAPEGQLRDGHIVQHNVEVVRPLRQYPPDVAADHLQGIDGGFNNGAEWGGGE